MSGLSRTPGKRVWVNSPPRVRIPLPPPPSPREQGFFFAHFPYRGWFEAFPSPCTSKYLDTSCTVPTRTVQFKISQG